MICSGFEHRDDVDETSIKDTLCMCMRERERERMIERE